MQFSVATLFTLLAAVAVAQPITPQMAVRSVINRRQAVSAEVASMTDADGNVVAYNAAGVKFPMKDAGN